ncbi:unnamed protein product [Adineta ricciae]|uniref:TIR domain-containing protein n=1 Tax=Adineta ricciae TaxID=249248 RepID=A0A815VTV7_ADIRI|nr:unnamed protein product [Adineta ricciae]
MGMLLKELSANDVHQVDVQPVVPKDAAEVILPSVSRTTTSKTKALSVDTERHNMLQWTQAEAQEWLTKHRLVQLCRLLSDCDGRSLVHLYRYSYQSKQRNHLRHIVCAHAMLPLHKAANTMKTSFDQLVSSLNACDLCVDTVEQLKMILEQEKAESLPSFINQSYDSLLILEQWAWQLLSEDYRPWTTESSYLEFFYDLTLFNRDMIFNNGDIDVDRKISLLFCVTIGQIDSIFTQIDQINDENDVFIRLINLSLENYAYFFYEQPQHQVPAVVDHIDKYIVRKYIMSKEHKFYLAKLHEPELAKKLLSFPYTAEEMVALLCDDYLEIIRIHSHAIESWSKEFLACIAQLISFMSGGFWWNGQQRTQIKKALPTEQITCSHVEDLIRIIAYKPFYSQTKSVRSNDETILIDSAMMILYIIVQSQNINWFFRSNLFVRDTIAHVSELALNDEVCLCGYCILGETLADDQLKAIKIADNISDYFFHIIEEAWKSLTKIFRQVPLQFLLEDFQILSKNDSVQQRTASSNKLSLFIPMCDQYPIVFDIIWALSFNHDIQQQLHQNTPFIHKLTRLSNQAIDEQIRKAVNGILWNLQIHQQSHPSPNISSQNTFDIMISYSHKDKSLCKQIYDELTRRNYRVWIDFDQMHGNVMDAMAQAIDRSRTIIICMSEEYRKSNFCRAEAHYAFQQQRHIVPVLLQKHYKPDGWLLFLIGQLLYVNFTKHEFDQAMEMLLKELKFTEVYEPSIAPVRPKANVQSKPIGITVAPSVRKISEWTQSEVLDWLAERELVQMVRLLAGCNGRSLVYLHSYMKAGGTRQTLSLLQQDSLRLTNQSLSIIELSRFQAAMDEQTEINH